MINEQLAPSEVIAMLNNYFRVRPPRR